MKLADVSPNTLLVLAGLVVAGLATFYVIRKGGLGKAAVSAVGDITSGAVGAVGAAVGLPTPDETSTDSAVARWIIDHPFGGHFEASKWAGAPAYLAATFMATGSGTPPPAGTDLARRFPELPQASYSNEHRRAPPVVEMGTAEDWFPTWVGA